MNPSFTMKFSGVYGGPCLGCGQMGYLFTHDGVLGPDPVRTLSHGPSEDRVTTCTMSTKGNRLRLDDNGNWYFNTE